MLFERALLTTLAVLAVFAATGTPARGAPVSFNTAGLGGTLNWADATNWSTNPLLPDPTDDATFVGNSTGHVFIQLGTDRTINSIVNGTVAANKHVYFGTAVDAQTLTIGSGLIFVPHPSSGDGGNLVFNSKVQLNSGTAGVIDMNTGSNSRKVSLLGTLLGDATTSWTLTATTGDFGNVSILEFGSKNNRATFLGAWNNNFGLVRYSGVGNMGDGQITFGVSATQVAHLNRNMVFNVNDTLINPFVFAPKTGDATKKPSVFFGAGNDNKTIIYDNAWTGTANTVNFGYGTADIIASKVQTHILTNSAKVNTFTATGGVFIFDSTLKVNKTSAFGDAANAVTLQTVAASGSTGYAPKLYWTTADAAVPYNFTVGRNFGSTGNIQFGSETGSVTYTGQVNLSLSDLTVVTKNTADTLTFDGNILGSNDLVIDQLAGGSGAGKVVFSAVNKAYTGTTTVNFGTLAVNVTIASSGVTVASGATLQGTGTITNGVTISAGGILAPGNSIGILTVGSADIDGIFNVEVDGTGPGSADLLDVLGNLDITNAVLDLDILAALDDPFYIIASYGSLTGTQFAGVLNLPTGYDVVYNYQGSKIALVIPEPATLGLLALGGLMMIFRGRRSTRSLA